MATSRRKTKTRASAKTKARRTRKKPVVDATQIDLGADGKGSEMEMKGGRLVVRISRESHPEIYDIDRLTKQVQKLIEAHSRKRKTRDLVEFLTETEKSLQIILRNHLEDAMRVYLS